MLNFKREAEKRHAARFRTGGRFPDTAGPIELRRGVRLTFTDTRAFHYSGAFSLPERRMARAAPATRPSSTMFKLSETVSDGAAYHRETRQNVPRREFSHFLFSSGPGARQARFFQHLPTPSPCYSERSYPCSETKLLVDTTATSVLIDGADGMA